MAITRVNTNNIKDSAVTLAKIANIADATILGNSSGGSAAPSALTTLPTGVQNNITRLGTVVSGTLSTGAVIGGVTMTLGSDATGDIYYRNSSGVLTRLPIGSNGNVLGVTAGLPAWTTAGAGTITGSGTTNKLAKFSSSTALTDSQLFDDGTNVYLGTTTTSSVARLLTIVNTNDSHIALIRNSNSVNCPRLYMYKSRGTYGSESDVQNGDQTGTVVAYGWSTSYFETGRMQFEIDGTFTTNQRPPGRIIFQTAVNNGAITTAMTINSVQQVSIQTTTDATSTTTGSLITAGGLGVAKSAYFGSTIFAAAATTSISSLNIPTGTAPTSPTVGDLWHSSAQKNIQVYTNGGVKSAIDTTLYTGEAPASTVANTNTETSFLLNGIGTLTLPANFFVVGKIVKIRIGGVFSTTGTPTLRIRIKIGGTTIYDSGNITTSATVSSVPWLVEFETICRTTGATGTLKSQARYTDLSNPGNGQIKFTSITGTTTLDMTGTLAIDATAQWSAASASNTITNHISYVQVLN